MKTLKDTYSELNEYIEPSKGEDTLSFDMKLELLYQKVKKFEDVDDDTLIVHFNDRRVYKIKVLERIK